MKGGGALKILIKLCIVGMSILAVSGVMFNSGGHTQADENIGVENQMLNVRTLEDKEFLIDSKPIIGLKYSDIIKIWGAPKEIKQVKVYFPATIEPNFSYILKYNSIDIEMYPEEEHTAVEDTTSFRFDITGDEYDFYGVEIGMSLKEYLDQVENKKVYFVRDILKDSAGERTPYVYQKLLCLVKPCNYYDNYEKAIYEEVVIDSIPYGAVILFNDNKVARIVYGYPNAS